MNYLSVFLSLCGSLLVLGLFYGGCVLLKKLKPYFDQCWWNKDGTQRSFLPYYHKRTKLTLQERISMLVGMKRSYSAEYVLNKLEVIGSEEGLRYFNIVITKIKTKLPRTWFGDIDHKDGEFEKLFVETQLFSQEENFTEARLIKKEGETVYQILYRLED